LGSNLSAYTHWRNGARRVGEVGEQADAVDRSTVGQLARDIRAEQSGDRREQIDRVDERVAVDSERIDVMAGDDHRHVDAAFEERALGLIGQERRQHHLRSRAVVADEDDRRVLEHCRIDRPEQPAELGVHGLDRGPRMVRRVGQRRARQRVVVQIRRRLVERAVRCVEGQVAEPRPGHDLIRASVAVDLFGGRVGRAPGSRR
jgi:hypothetical protein